jgi:hypothetical protein
VFAAEGGAESLQTDVQFKMQFHRAINAYMQNWPVYDIIPKSFQEIPRHTARDSTYITNPEIVDYANETAPSGSDIVEVTVPLTSNHTLENSGGSESGADRKTEEDYDPTRLDLIIDVSTKETRQGGVAGLREAGSTSMLRGYGYNFGHQGGSARQHRPPSPAMERSIQV